MTKQTISLAPDEAVELQRIGGDLHVEGSDQQDLRATGELVTIERRSGTAVVSCAGDLKIFMARNSRLTLGSIGGDLDLEDLTGTVEIGMVGGDVALRNLTGAVRLVGMIGGDVHMENVGNVSVNSPKAGERFNSADLVRRRVDHATRQAEARIRRAEQRVHQVSLAYGQPDAASHDRPPAEPVNPAGEEERIAILRMLQEHKITSEQAEKLLAALDVPLRRTPGVFMTPL
jgi:hypothetical protein